MVNTMVQFMTLRAPRILGYCPEYVGETDGRTAHDGLRTHGLTPYVDV
jgi:hypothetical protein